jgi:putative aminopeptidase FrvX
LGIYALSATQEEVGYRGAIVGSYSINPDVGIAIDVTHSTDTPSSDTKGAEIKLGEGGVLCISPSTNVRVADLIKAAAKRNKIKMQVEASGCPMGTDTNVVQTTRSGVATALISVPLRYMHTQVETCSLDDLEATIDLIVATILGIEKGQSFLP